MGRQSNIETKVIRYRIAILNNFSDIAVFRFILDQGTKGRHFSVKICAN